MNLWNSQKWIFLLLLLISSTCFAQTKVEVLLKTLFTYIENADTSREIKMRARDQILRLGAVALPHVKKRFLKTENPDYLYLIQKLEKTKVVKANIETWQKEAYFFNHYQTILKAVKEKEWEKAKKIAKAILTLEPDIHFNDSLKKIIKNADAEDFSNKVLSIKISPEKKYYFFEEQPILVITFHNRSSRPVVLYAKKKVVSLRITVTVFDLWGNMKVEKLSKFLTLDEEISISSGESWRGNLRISPRKKLRFLSYQELDIVTNIPLLTVSHEGKQQYPKVNLPKVKLSILPRQYQQAVYNPMKNFRSSLKLLRTKWLFFSSFFVPKSQKKQAITLLIESLPKVNKNTVQIIIGILKRYTGKNFHSINHWKNWWIAQKEFFQPS